MAANIGIVVQRILIGALAIAFLLSLFITDYLIAQWATERSGVGIELLRRGSVVPLMFLIMLGLGVGEMVRLFRARGLRPLVLPSYGLTLALVALPWLSPAGYLGQSIADTEGLYWSLAGAAAAVLLVGICCVLRNDPIGTIPDASATLLIVLYLGLLGSFGLQLRCGPISPAHQGVWLLLIAILVSKCSDIGGYLVGTALGRHKLIPAISPGKTVEGAFGGILASGLASVLIAWPAQFASLGTSGPGPYLWIWNQITCCFGNIFGTNNLRAVFGAFIFGAIISIFAQFGDLFESCLKRDARIKDSGSVMPHYGGILDLVDSPLFTLPVAWFLLTRVWNIP